MIHGREPSANLSPAQTTHLETMSHLQRSFAKAKLAGLPSEPPLPQSALLEDEGDDELWCLAEPAPDDDSSSASSASSTGTIRPSPSKHLFARPKGFVESECPFFETQICYIILSSDNGGEISNSRLSMRVFLKLSLIFLDQPELPLVGGRWIHSHGTTSLVKNSTWKTYALERPSPITSTLPRPGPKARSS